MSEIGHFRFSYPAAADLSGSQFYLVELVGGEMALSGAGEFGRPLQNKPEAGQAAEVEKVGLSECIAGAAIAADALVTSDANGKAVTATTNDIVCGQAVSAAAADGDRFTLDPFYGGVAA
jgi:hypothetical protein